MVKSVALVAVASTDSEKLQQSSSLIAAAAVVAAELSSEVEPVAAVPAVADNIFVDTAAADKFACDPACQSC